jgi:hypothetical protein
MGDNKIERQEPKSRVGPGRSRRRAKQHRRGNGQGNDIERHTFTRKPLAPDERRARIADAAYRIAERRGFAPGSELDDWLTAGRELEADEKTAPPSSD